MIETEINWPKQINKILLILNEYFIFYSINRRIIIYILYVLLTNYSFKFLKKNRYKKNLTKMAL